MSTPSQIHFILLKTFVTKAMVSLDVDSLFTNIPQNERIVFYVQQ